MPDAICNTSPLLYLHRIGTLDWLPKFFSSIWSANAVLLELQEGGKAGHDVPYPATYTWLKIADPRAVPSEWLTLDLGPGELAVLALGLENPDRIILLDDDFARRVARAAGLQVWGTLRVLLEAKSRGLITHVEPLITRLKDSGMWISDEIRARVLALAGEK